MFHEGSEVFGADEQVGKPGVRCSTIAQSIFGVAAIPLATKLVSKDVGDGSRIHR